MLEKVPEEDLCKWREAAKSYEQILKTGTISDPTLVGEYWQRIGYCYDLASRQVSSAEDFQILRRASVDAYGKAAESYGNESLRNQGKKDQCLAFAEYNSSWLAKDPAGKVEKLDSCRALTIRAKKRFKEANDSFEYAHTANLLSKCLLDRLYVASDWEEIQRFSCEAAKNSEEAIGTLSKIESKEGLVEAYSLAGIQFWYIANTSEKEEERKSKTKCSVAYSENALKLSDKLEDPYCKAIARWASAVSTLYFTDKIETALEIAQSMREQARLVRDHLFEGVACYLVAHVMDWQVLGEVNPAKRRQIYDEILRFSEEGTRHLELVLQHALVADTYLFSAQTNSIIASDYATNLAEKIVYSRKAIEIGKKGLDFAIRSGAPEAMISTLHGLSKAYHYRSDLEQRIEDKPEYLRESLGFRKEYIKIAKNAFPSNLWILGVGLVYAAKIETDLSKTEQDEKTKASFLEEAMADMQEGISSCKNWVASCSVPSLVASVAGFEDGFGAILVEGYSLSSEPENLRKANRVYGEAAEDFKKVDIPSRVAESYWKIAKNFDLLNDFEQSGKNFENAFAAYKVSAQKINQFSDFYLDYASYMKSWSEIESAKDAHNSENFLQAKAHYEKACQLLQQSKSWMHLSPNFYAWAFLEEAEDHSRKEKNEESISVFEKALNLFRESKRTLTSKLGSIEKSDEKALAKRLIEASDVREEYCRGRMAIEEAKLLDKKGEHMASASKYDEAAIMFQKLSLLDSEKGGREAKPLAYLCRAWQKLTTAEARGSAILYEEAADLFRQANENMFKKSASLMALGHSSFCKALEAGTEFEITRSFSMYDEAVKHLDTAANYYLKAGYEASSDYARATQRLFDAYVFMENAKRERDPSKQARYYSMAEKVLERASDCFVKGNYQDKNEQVQRFLRKVKEERELALSLGEILHAPSITSSTASFEALSAVEEKAAGLERFEHADIQTRIVQHETEVRIGNTVNLEIQIVNVGKEPVSLTRIENIAPSGFQIVSKPDYCQIDGTNLVMKGVRLDPLQTNEIPLVLKSCKIGSIEIMPRMICVDWIGQLLSSTPESVQFSVLGESLPGRVPTGYSDLDNLLLGGIPESYSVVLSSPSSDERELIIKKFLETGANAGQITYYVATEAGDVINLVESFQSNFILFLCNPRADVMIKALPNVYKLKGVESLTDIEIALIKSFRAMDASRPGPKRACITILSDVLLQHHAVITRKWLSGLLSDLKSKGFTTLAVVNPQMHPPEEFQAIVGLFEGEIRITERETNVGLEKTLRVRKMYGQRYLESGISVTRERIEA